MVTHDVSNRAQAVSLLSDTSRKNEVQRLAQGVAAEQFGIGQQQGVLQNGNSAHLDTAKISDEAIQEISSSGKAEGMQRTDQLVSALREAYQTKTGGQSQTPGQAGAANGEGSADGVGAASGAHSQKKKEKKRTAHWEPIAEENQIHPEGREVIGKITIKEEVREVGAPGQSAKGSKGGGQSQGGAGTPQSSSPPSGNSSPSALGRTGPSNGNSSATQPVEGGKDSEKSKDDEGKNDQAGGAAMSQNLKASGLQAPGMEKGVENYEVGEKSKDFDVRSPATGASQTLSVRGSGDLGSGGQKLGTYKKLDDKPALKYASLHAKGSSLDSTSSAYAAEAQRNGERPDQIQATVQQLKKTTPDG